MIVIYNLSGLLFGVLAAGIGIATAAVTDRPSVGLAAFALILIGSAGWFRGASHPRGRRRFPSVFFVPLWIPGILLLLISGPLFLAEAYRKSLPPDPRQAKLDADEAELRRLTTSGDV